MQTLSSELLKPKNDKRQYRLVELRNGLRALLIHDAEITAPEETVAPTRACCTDILRGGAHFTSLDDVADDASPGSSKMAACALCLGVGSMSDPESVQGLAHYVEHMVFMGTAAHPNENGWNKYLSSHGGQDNGETDSETTTFYFDVHPNYLQPALGRFVQFFISPLFKWGGSRREVQAIDSEFEQALQADVCREQQLLWHLCDPAHPYHAFGWGNKRSLVDLPKASKIPVRSELLAFHRKHYSSRLMTLAIIGNEPLDTLQSWVESACSAIPDRTSPRPSFGASPPPLPSSLLPLLVHVRPLEQRRSLHLQWFVPSQLEHHKSKPLVYIGHLLGHEGVGSVLYALKAAGLATELCAGNELSISAAVVLVNCLLPTNENLQLTTDY